MEGIGAMIQVWSVEGWFFVVGSFDGPSVFVFVCVCAWVVVVVAIVSWARGWSQQTSFFFFFPSISIGLGSGMFIHGRHAQWTKKK
jgi:hypothetical protein